jgi:hypothetical protein
MYIYLYNKYIFLVVEPFVFVTRFSLFLLRHHLIAGLKLLPLSLHAAVKVEDLDSRWRRGETVEYNVRWQRQSGANGSAARCLRTCVSEKTRG